MTRRQRVALLGYLRRLEVEAAVRRTARDTDRNAPSGCAADMPSATLGQETAGFCGCCRHGSFQPTNKPTNQGRKTVGTALPSLACHSEPSGATNAASGLPGPEAGGMTVANARHLAAMPDKARRAVLAGLTEPELAALEFSWEFWARADQMPPQAPWRVFLLLGGRGSGKTRAAAEWVRGELEAGRRRQIGMIAPTADTLRRICVEGPSGLLMTSPPWNRPSFEPSTRRVVYPGDGVVHLFSAEEPDRLRGPNLDGLWIDELTSMANATRVLGHGADGVAHPRPAGRPAGLHHHDHTETIATAEGDHRLADNRRDAGTHGRQRGEPRCVYTGVSARQVWRHAARAAGTGRRTDRRCGGRAVDPQAPR